MVRVTNESQVSEISSKDQVGIVLGINSSSEEDATGAVAAFLKANPDYEGNVAVVQSNHGLLDATMNHITGGISDPTHLKLVQDSVSRMLHVSKGNRVILIGHSDGSTALDRALGNLGVNGSNSRGIYYFGSPMSHSSVDNVHWVVRNGDPVTRAGSFWRFGFSDTTRLSGFGHSFEGYMRDAGAIW